MEKMADTTEQKPCTISKEVEVHVEAIQRLVKGHGHGQKNLQELGDHVCDTTNSDKCGNSCSLSTISQYIDKIHQVINEEKTNLELSSSSSGQQNLSNLAKEVLAADTIKIEKALNNSVVLRAIMKHLDTKDLLNVRAVAKKWEEEATILLLSSRQNIQVYFRWDGEEFKFQNRVGTLDEFTDCCYGNGLRAFPCSQFYFLCLQSSLDFTPVLSNFFSNHGHHVKSLHLYFPLKSPAALGIVRKIVFEWTPNLKSLTLNGQNFQSDDEPSFLEIENTSKSALDGDIECSKLSLEYLEVSKNVPGLNDPLAAKHWSQLITDILSSAPNLKTISDEFQFAKEIILAGKTRAVHRLVWKVYDENMMTQCAEFSQARPQLTFLEVDLLSFVDPDITSRRNPPSNFLPSLQLILQSSRKTLKTLTFQGRFDSLIGASQLNIPVLENLQKFWVRYWDLLEGGQGRGRLLPQGFSVQKLFPRLKTLHIEGVGVKTADQADNPFSQSCNSSTTIEELIIVTASGPNYCFHSDWLCQAREMYPNVRVLKLYFHNKYSEMPEICDAIWTYWNTSCLEELSMNFHPLFPEDYYPMDHALTGFDEETCRMLEKQRCCKHGHGAEEFERGPSILDMKKLKSFQLMSRGVSLLSRVSVIHVLEPMRRSQNLRWTINGIGLRWTNYGFGLRYPIQDGHSLDFSVPDCQIEMNEYYIDD